MTEDYARAREMAEPKPLRYVQLGWWVQSFDGEHESWDRVVFVGHGKVPETGLPIVRLLMQDHTNPDHGWELCNRADEPVLCLKKKDAAKAGLVEAVKTDG